jgi:mannose-6-phosphate isomerase-like protein (cupin superfamily)
MNESIVRPDLETEFYTAERCHITEFSNSPDDPELSIARVRVEPTVTTAWHLLRDTAERYIILSGEGRMEVGGLPAQQVATGDIVLIPPNCPQRICNTTTADLLFLAICTPRFVNEAYEDLEEALN